MVIFLMNERVLSKYIRFYIHNMQDRIKTIIIARIVHYNLVAIAIGNIWIMQVFFISLSRALGCVNSLKPWNSVRKFPKTKQKQKLKKFILFHKKKNCTAILKNGNKFNSRSYSKWRPRFKNSWLFYSHSVWHFMGFRFEDCRLLLWRALPVPKLMGLKNLGYVWGVWSEELGSKGGAKIVSQLTQCVHHESRRHLRPATRSSFLQCSVQFWRRSTNMKSS